MDSQRRGTKGKLRAAFFNPKEKRNYRSQGICKG